MLRFDTVHCYDITRYELRDGGRHLLTFDSLAELQAFAELATQAVELAEYAREWEQRRLAKGAELLDVDAVELEVSE